MVSAAVDTGAVVGAGQPLGVVYATDVYEVAVPLRVEELAWLDLPAVEADGSTGPGARARVSGVGPRGPFEVAGRLARVAGELDATSRFAHAVVEIRTDEHAPGVAGELLPGAFVDVEFDGRALDDVSELRGRRSARTASSGSSRRSACASRGRPCGASARGARWWRGWRRARGS